MSKRKSAIGQRKSICCPEEPWIDKPAKLTTRELRYLYAYFLTLSHSKAAAMVGLKGKDPRRAGIRLYNKTREKLSFHDLLEYLGLDDVVFSHSLWAGINAVVTKTATHQGVITDERTYIDYAARFRYLELMARIKGLLDNRDTFPDARAKITGVQWIDELGDEDHDEDIDLSELDLADEINREDLGLEGRGARGDSGRVGGEKTDGDS